MATQRAPTIDGVSPSVMQLPQFAAGTGPASLLLYLERLAHIPKGQSWVLRMKSGLVLDENVQTLNPESPYIAGQRIYYYRHMPDEPRVPFDENIVYQDAHLLVADKPHFLPVSPTGRYVQESLLVRLKRRTGLDDLVPIHRIDRDTAGLVLFSVQRNSRDAYAALFRQRAVQKTYEAIAPCPAQGLSLPAIHRSRLTVGDNFMQMREVAGEPNSQTHIALVERLDGLARYTLQPVTGKRHQLRVHMCALGMPICGDQIYPVMTPEPDPSAMDYSQPLQLLAKSLEFVDPVSGVAQRFDSELRLKGAL